MNKYISFNNFLFFSLNLYYLNFNQFFILYYLLIEYIHLYLFCNFLIVNKALLLFFISTEYLNSTLFIIFSFFNFTMLHPEYYTWLFIFLAFFIYNYDDFLKHFYPSFYTKYKYDNHISSK
jgi:hypothetical protein